MDVTTEVVGDKVKVHWKDNNQPELVSGAYAAVSEVYNDSRLSSTAFIHAEDPRTKSITLSGLVPQMTYSIRVCVKTFVVFLGGNLGVWKSFSGFLIYYIFVQIILKKLNNKEATCWSNLSVSVVRYCDIVVTAVCQPNNKRP